jgi:hypothetical protein
MPVGRPYRKSARMMFQSGPKPPCRGNETTHPPRHSFSNEYAVTRPEARTVPIAAPAVPYAGIGPRPLMKTTLNSMFSTVNTMPSTIGVRASPAARSAPPSMKKTSIPLLNTKRMRIYGSASAFTAGAAFTSSSSQGESTYPRGAMTSSEMLVAVRNAW